MAQTKTQNITMEKVMNDPAYRGYHVIVVAGKVFKARTGERARELLKEAQEKYSKEIPKITYLPKDALIPPDFRNLSFFQHLSRVNGEFLGH